MNATPLHEALARRLQPLHRADRESWQRRALAIMLALAALAAPLCGWWAMQRGLTTRGFWISYGALVVAAELFVLFLAVRRRKDPIEMARRVESEQPELRGALLAALEQEAASDGTLGFLQTQVFQKALAHGAKHDWLGERNRAVLRRRGRVLLLALALFGVSMLGTSQLLKHEPQIAKAAAAPARPVEAARPSVAVVPGDAEVERGSRLIVEAKFKGRAPGEAALLLLNEDGSLRGRFAMNSTVDPNVFGGVITGIAKDARYRVEFEGGASETYRITTFEYPALVRVDATITPPAWTGQQPTLVKNTMNIGVMEGSRVDFKITVNKSLAQSEWFGEDKSIIPLKPSGADGRVIEGGFMPVKSQKYRLHLVDDRERANKNPPWLTVRVLPNQPPKIEMTFPKRDLAVSPIQELPVEGKVWDDLGVQRAGATFLIGDETREVPLGDTLMKGGKKHDLKTLLNLEPMGARPRQLVSYFLWAEDRGADGRPRRAMSDMFFAEVRNFEDIFREAEAPPGAEGQAGQKGQTDELMATQKQVVNATWRVLRDSGDGRPFESMEKDVGVLHESQEIVREKTEAAIEKVKDAQIAAALRDAAKSMTQASSELAQVASDKKAEGLNPALGSERRALEALQRAQSREHQVMQSRSSKGKNSQGSKQMQSQLQNLELKQQERRYEEQKEAGEEAAGAEQQENLQVLSRLKELAARQEALAQKMKELEQQLQNAKTDAEKDELDRQLKRLQEEQEQLLRDMDSLKERMEKPENLAQMSDLREKVEQAREQARQAAEQLAQQQAAQASASATKAQRQIEDVRDDLRQRTSKKFADEMRGLKDQTRKLESDEKKISEAIEKAAEPKADLSGDTSKQLQRAMEGNQIARQLEEQQKALEATLENARKITEAAEIAEPALSSALYDAARKAETGGAVQGLENARDLAAANNLPDAMEQEHRAAKGITELRENIERAAEKVLGSEAEALRMARAELDRLMKELDPAAKPGGEPGAPAGGDEKTKPEDGQPQSQPGGNAKDIAQNKQEGGDPSKAGNEPGKQDGKPAESSENKPGQQPGQQPGKQEDKVAEGSGNKPGEKAGQQPGQQPGKGEGEKAVAAAGAGGQSEPTDPNGKNSGADTKEQQGKEGQPNGGKVAQNGGARAGARTGADDRDGGWFFDAPQEAVDHSPLTGDGYDRWSDRLRRVEELLEVPELRNQAARVRDDARQLRLDHRRNDEPPKADVVRMRVTQPLMELRNRVAEELARREEKNPLAPLDRDPVPSRFRELVRRYYTELGAGK